MKFFDYECSYEDVKEDVKKGRACYIETWINPSFGIVSSPTDKLKEVEITKKALDELIQEFPEHRLCPLWKETLAKIDELSKKFNIEI